MNPNPFRFGAAIGFVPDGATLVETARQIERHGYSTMLVADGLWLPAPFGMLTAAATATSTLRVGTHVLAAPLRAPALVAQEAHTLDLLSAHRFELGLGTGQYPATLGDAERLGVPFGTRAERVARVGETITAVQEHFTANDRQAPRILIAGTGRTLVELAAVRADTLALPVPYDRSEDGLAAKVDELRTAVGARFDRLELAMNILAVGDKPAPDWVPSHFRELPADSYGRLAGDPAEIADTLRRRRDRTGVSYVTVPQWCIDDFAPVVELLAGQ